MTGPEKIFASKTEVKNPLNLGNQNIQKIEKLQTFDSSCFRGKSHFEDDGIQNVLAFQVF